MPLHHRLMRYTDNAVTQPAQHVVPPRIRYAPLSVIPAVHLHDELARRCNKVSDIPPERHLTTKPNTQPRPLQRLPKPRLRKRERMAVHSRTSHVGCRRCRTRTRKRTPKPLLSPTKEKGFSPSSAGLRDGLGPVQSIHGQLLLTTYRPQARRGTCASGRCPSPWLREGVSVPRCHRPSCMRPLYRYSGTAQSLLRRS